MQSVNIITLGCSKNVVDSEKLMRQALAAGFKVVNDDYKKFHPVTIINTCGFINDAREESVNTILDFARAKVNKKIKQLYVIGCLSERYKDDLKAEIPEVDEFFGVNHIEGIMQQLHGSVRTDLLNERLLTTPGHFAYLKVSEGCDRSCSFCSIPLIRGKHISRAAADICAEARFLVSQGVKELILVAQDLTYYGLDSSGQRQIQSLTETLAQMEGLHWLRLHYAYPAGFPLGLLDVIKQYPTVCRYLDIPVQHASDNILKRMHRGITQAETVRLLDTIRQKIPGIALRTTLITGYPGETAKDYDQLCRFVESQRFERLGVFAYSHEEDTWAHGNEKDRLTQKEKDERVAGIMEIQQDISLENNRARVGQTLEVIIDRIEQNLAIGRTEFDSPEVDNEVIVRYTNKAPAPGDIVKVMIEEAAEFDLTGSVC